MATAFDTALDTASDQVIGYATAALPLVALVSAAWLGPKIVKKVINRFG